MTITLQILEELFPSTRSEVLSPYASCLDGIMIQYDINTKQRQAAFISQVGFESEYFTHVEENLNYSADTLVRLFPSHFSSDIVSDYAHQPIKIANRLYANRMGNGDEASGDGWKHHGRGPIQITGKTNYTLCAEFLKLSIDDLIKYITSPTTGVLSSAWFWTTNHLNVYADKNDFVGLTKRINGGTLGLPIREKLFEKAMSLL